MIESLDTSVSVASSSERRGPIKSKIGSLSNVKHRPGGGNVKIESRRTSYIGVGSRVSSRKGLRVPWSKFSAQFFTFFYDVVLPVDAKYELEIFVSCLI